MDVVGFVSFCEFGDGILIVALGVIPAFQGCGVGGRLVSAVLNEARRLSKRRVLVSTSNDDLPALGFYQSLGFRICGIALNAIAEKHGGVIRGFGGIPVRDEIRLEKNV